MSHDKHFHAQGTREGAGSSKQAAASGRRSSTSEVRRKLVRGGLLGAPVLLALKSTPVLAVNCKAPSGFTVSGNLSQTNSDNCLDAAQGPAYWLSPSGTDADNFTNTGVKKNAKFSTYFSNSPSSNYMLNDALSAGGLVAKIVAAFLDASITPKQFPIDATEVQKMWNLGVNGVGYYPFGSGTIVWYAVEVEDYLNYAMHLN